MSAIRRWQPFRDLMGVQRDVDRIFDEFFGRPLALRDANGVRVPSVDVAETSEDVIVTAEVPGVDREGLEVEVTPESLSIKAEATSQSEDREATIHRRERVWRRYERTIPLPAEVVSDKAEAHLEEGVLKVRIPKTERTKAETPTRVKVE